VGLSKVHNDHCKVAGSLWWLLRSCRKFIAANHEVVKHSRRPPRGRQTFLAVATRATIRSWYLPRGLQTFLAAIAKPSKVHGKNHGAVESSWKPLQSRQTFLEAMVGPPNVNGGHLGAAEHLR
jgi:hypothetical protein